MQNLKPYDKAAVIDPQTVTTTGADGKPQTQMVREQTIAQGPVASQEIIKQFGTNGGGFFNANSAHPFENPTPLTNFLAMFGIFAISSGPHLHARLDDRIAAARLGGVGGDGVPLPGRRHRRVLGRSARQPDADRGRRRSDGDGDCRRAATWKGKEVRFGIANTALFATVDHRRELRRDQRLARLVHAARRPRAARQHPVERSRVRRRRRRHVRRAGLHHPRRCSSPA